MGNTKKGIERLFPVIILLLPFLITPAPLFAEGADRKTEQKSESKADFVLTIKDDLISLKAKDVALKEILEEIGQRMKIEVVANIPEQEKVSIEFEKLSLEDAIKRLSTNYGYLMDTAKEEKRITRIIVLAKGKETGKAKSPRPKPEEAVKEKKSRPEPFKFEFDPSEFTEKGGSSE